MRTRIVLFSHDPYLSFPQQRPADPVCILYGRQGGSSRVQQFKGVCLVGFLWFYTPLLFFWGVVICDEEAVAVERLPDLFFFFMGEKEVFSLRLEWLDGECDWIRSFKDTYLSDNPVLQIRQERIRAWG